MWQRGWHEHGISDWRLKGREREKRKVLSEWRRLLPLGSETHYAFRRWLYLILNLKLNLNVFFSFRVFPFLQFFITFPLSLLFLASSATLRLSLHHHSALVVFLPFAFNHVNRMLFQYLCQVSSRPWCCHFTFLSHSLFFEREESFEIQCGYGFRSHGYIVRDISMLTTLRGQLLLWTFSVKMKTFYAIREILRDPAHFNSLMRFQPLSPTSLKFPFVHGEAFTSTPLMNIFNF